MALSDMCNAALIVDHFLSPQHKAAALLCCRAAVACNEQLMTEVSFGLQVLPLLLCLLAQVITSLCIDVEFINGSSEHKELHVPCRCEKKCSNMKACGRHQCRRRCCDGDCPPCDLPCGRRLRCGNHKCPAPCHSGLCLPCPLTATVSCACGHTSYKLPCGSEGKAVAPKCQEMCPVPPTCRHADSRLPHRY